MDSLWNGGGVIVKMKSCRNEIYVIKFVKSSCSYMTEKYMWMLSKRNRKATPYSEIVQCIVYSTRSETK